LASAKTSVQAALFHELTLTQSSANGGTGKESEANRGCAYDPTEQQRRLTIIAKRDSQLADHFSEKLLLQKSLTRQLVSFQANKVRPGFRWYKYKEAFSAPLIDYLLSRYDVTKGTVLDPFAGAGTAIDTETMFRH